MLTYSPLVLPPSFRWDYQLTTPHNLTALGTASVANETRWRFDEVFAHHAYSFKTIFWGSEAPAQVATYKTDGTIECATSRSAPLLSNCTLVGTAGNVSQQWVCESFGIRATWDIADTTGAPMRLRVQGASAFAGDAILAKPFSSLPPPSAVLSPSRRHRRRRHSHRQLTRNHIGCFRPRHLHPPRPRQRRFRQRLTGWWPHSWPRSCLPPSRVSVRRRSGGLPDGGGSE